MFYCHECAIEFAEKEGYNLHLQSAHSPTKRKCKKKTKLRMVKIALKSSPKKKQYVILNTTYIYFFFENQNNYICTNLNLNLLPSFELSTYILTYIDIFWLNLSSI